MEGLHSIGQVDLVGMAAGKSGWHALLMTANAALDMHFAGDLRHDCAVT